MTQKREHERETKMTTENKNRPWTVEPTATGRYRLRNTRTNDTADGTFAALAEAQADADATNDRAEKIAADVRARTAAAKARQAEIDAIRPTRILTNGRDY
jgi:hypothetical protein